MWIKSFRSVCNICNLICFFVKLSHEIYTESNRDIIFMDRILSDFFYYWSNDNTYFFIHLFKGWFGNDVRVQSNGPPQSVWLTELQILRHMLTRYSILFYLNHWKLFFKQQVQLEKPQYMFLLFQKHNLKLILLNNLVSDTKSDFEPMEKLYRSCILLIMHWRKFQKDC